MTRRTLEVSSAHDGARIDAFLADSLPELSRSAAQRLCEDGLVTLRGVPARKNARVAAGDSVECTLPEPRACDAEPQDIPLSVVYEDDDVLVIDKPRGMVVHPAAGNWDGTVVNAVLAHCGDTLSGVGGALRPGVVHRIDKDTSGLLILAKNDAAHLALSHQLHDHSLAREYEAVVCGTLRDDRGTIDAPLARSTRDRKKIAVTRDGTGRRAVTHYEVLARYPGYTHVLCRLETGRTHQIRVHMAHLGHPVAGDPVYGPKHDKTGLDGQCLHARRLRFVHPTTGETMTLECPLPDYFTAFLKKLGAERAHG